MDASKNYLLAGNGEIPAGVAQLFFPHFIVFCVHAASQERSEVKVSPHHNSPDDDENNESGYPATLPAAYAASGTTILLTLGVN